MEQVQCPKCSSYKVKPTMGGHGKYGDVASVLAGFGCLGMLLTLFFPPLGLLGLGLFFTAGLMGVVKKKTSGVAHYRCKGCGANFAVPAA